MFHSHHRILAPLHIHTVWTQTYTSFPSLVLLNFPPPTPPSPSLHPSLSHSLIQMQEEEEEEQIQLSFFFLPRQIYSCLTTLLIALHGFLFPRLVDLLVSQRNREKYRWHSQLTAACQTVLVLQVTWKDGPPNCLISQMIRVSGPLLFSVRFSRIFLLINYLDILYSPNFI